jgi:peptidase E
MTLIFLSNTRTNETRELFDLIVRLLPNNSKIGYISSSPDNERKYLHETEGWFAKTGNKYIFEYLDIHNEKDWTFDRIENFDGFFISGGNTYNLMNAINNSGMRESLIKIAHDTEKPIIGVSAGGIILTPNISIASAENEIGLLNHSGLGLVNFGFYPHFNNSPSEIQEIEEFKNTTGLSKVYAVSDTSAVLVDNSGITLI